MDAARPRWQPAVLPAPAGSFVPDAAFELGAQPLDRQDGRARFATAATCHRLHSCLLHVGGTCGALNCSCDFCREKCCWTVRSARIWQETTGASPDPPRSLGRQGAREGLRSQSPAAHSRAPRSVVLVRGRCGFNLAREGCPEQYGVPVVSAKLAVFHPLQS